MIRSKPSTDAYRDAWERVFADAEPEPRNTDAINVKIKTYLWKCETCQAYVSDPENHQDHVTIGPLTEPTT